MRLWEQDFGEWGGSGLFRSRLILARFSNSDLATHLVRRTEKVSPIFVCGFNRALTDLAGQGGRIAVIAHAGVVRAGLAHALGGDPGCACLSGGPRFRSRGSSRRVVGEMVGGLRQSGRVMKTLHIAGHFGEWMQGRIGPDGPVAAYHTATARRLASGFGIAPAPQGLRLHGVGLSAQQVRRFLAPASAELARRGRGCARRRNSALAPVFSTARLVGAGAAGRGGRARHMIWRALASHSRGASDPLAFAAPSRLLWGSRNGTPLAEMPGLPRYEILGGFLGGPRWTDPQDQSFPDISDLIGPWRQARNLRDIAALASQSATRCQAMRGPRQ